MYSEVIEELLAMGEYPGTLDGFIDESTARIQGVLNCSAEQADRILASLREHGQIDCEEVPAAKQALTSYAIPLARWYWYVPPAA